MKLANLLGFLGLAGSSAEVPLAARFPDQFIQNSVGTIFDPPRLSVAHGWAGRDEARVVVDEEDEVDCGSGRNAASLVQ